MADYTGEFYALCRKERTAGHAEEADIETAEEQLGLMFPDDYREFLEKFGALVGSGIEIYGIIDRESQNLWQSVVDVNLKLRKIKQIGSERKRFFAISDDGMSLYFFIDANASPKTSIWAIGPHIEREISNDIAEFFVNFEKYSAL
jgi:hypothetical protein